MVLNKLSLSITARILTTRALDNGSVPAPFFFWNGFFLFFQIATPPRNTRPVLLMGVGEGKGGVCAGKVASPFFPLKKPLPHKLCVPFRIQKKIQGKRKRTMARVAGRRAVRIKMTPSQDPITLMLEDFQMSFGLCTPDGLLEPGEDIELDVGPYLSTTEDGEVLEELLKTMVSQKFSPGEYEYVSSLLKNGEKLESLSALTKVMDYLGMEKEMAISFFSHLAEHVADYDRQGTHWSSFIDRVMLLSSCILQWNRPKTPEYFETLTYFLDQVWNQFRRFPPVLKQARASASSSSLQEVYDNYAELVVRGVLIPLAGSQERPNGDLRLEQTLRYLKIAPDKPPFLSRCTTLFVRGTGLMGPKPHPSKGELVMLNFLQAALLDKIHKQAHQMRAREFKRKVQKLHVIKCVFPTRKNSNATPLAGGLSIESSPERVQHRLDSTENSTQTGSPAASVQRPGKKQRLFF